MTARKAVHTMSLVLAMVLLVSATTGCPMIFQGKAPGSVSFVANPTTGPAPQLVRFFGCATVTAPYEAAAWSWNFGDGTTGTGQHASHTYPAAGAYTVTLQVSLVAPKFRGQADFPPVTLQATSDVIITDGNLRPIADAGIDQNVFFAAGTQVPLLVTLDGSGSYDPDGDPITYAWSFLSRPAGSTAALTGADTVNPTFVPDRKGVYEIELVVNDGALDSLPDTVVVTVGNRSPVAEAGINQDAFIGTLVGLNGNGSSDPDGDPLTYAWSFVSRPGGSAAALTGATTMTPSFTPDRKGTYQVRLVVNDGIANSPEDTMTVTVGNRPPIANAGIDQNAFIGTLVGLNGNGSSDPDGDLLTYAWSFVSRPGGSAAVLTGATTMTPSFTPDRKGTYQIQLVVNDGTANSLPDSMTVTVGNRQPIANAGVDREADTQELVTLNGNGSSDPDGDPLTYAWTFYVPPQSSAVLANANTATPSFTADLPGTYTAQLIVNDGTVDSEPDAVVVSVGQANRPPLALGLALPNFLASANVYADIEDSELTPNVETLYGVQRYAPYPQDAEKQNGEVVLLHIDPDTAQILDGTPITLIVDDGGFLYPVVADEAKGLAVDPTTGQLWAILGFYVGGGDYKQAYGNYSVLARVNPYTGVAMPAVEPFDTSLPELYAGIAVDAESLMYGVTGNEQQQTPVKVVDTPHALYGIDVTDYADTFLLQFPEPPDVFRTPGEVIAFNTDDGLMYHGSGMYESLSDRIFQSLNLDTLARGAVAITPGEDSWERPTAMTYAPGTGNFYLADTYGEGGTALYRIGLSGSTATETLVGYPDTYSPIKGLAFLYDRTFPGPEVELDASGSSDPDGDSLTYLWTFKSVPTASNLYDSDLSDPTGETTSFTPDVKGVYEIQVVVNDGEFDSAPSVVTINYLNSPPVANAGSDQLVPPYQGTVQLNGGDSYDPDGNTLEYSWTFLSVPTGSSVDDLSLSGTEMAAPTFYGDVTNTSEPYVLQLTVTDEDGETATDTVQIFIEQWN